MTDDQLIGSAMKDKATIFWGYLTEKEGDELMDIFKLRTLWYQAWNCVSDSHHRYGIPYNGPAVFLDAVILIRCEELCRKGWGVSAYKENEKLVRVDDTETAQAKETKV